MNSRDAVLLLAFGGPASPEEVRPFLRRVLRGVPVPDERVEEVVRHYEAVGGRSPLSEITLLQGSALQDRLREDGLSLPVYVGLRYSRPFLRDTLECMAADGIQRAFGLILSPHASEASRERYRREIDEARSGLDSAPAVDYCPGWHAHPLLVETWVERLDAELEKLPADRRRSCPIVFTAHSIPLAMASASPYAAEIEESCRLVAAVLRHERWSIAYQSRSGRPGEPWLEPDIGVVLKLLAAEGHREVLVAPIGFVADHVEVLYDLDIAARRVAEESGMRFLRAGCPNGHPKFLRMMADIVERERGS
jgi:ferrochelatase